MTVGAILPSAKANEAGRPSRIIDTHTHFYDRRLQGVPWPSKSDSVLYRRTLPQELRKVVQGLRVTGTVVVKASPWLADNQWLLDLAKENPLIVGVVGRLEADGPMFKSHLQRFATPAFSRNLNRRQNDRKRFVAPGLHRRFP
jgi:L-fuconolactonase